MGNYSYKNIKVVENVRKKESEKVKKFMVEIRVKNIIVVSNVDGLKKVKSNINFVVEIRVKKAIPASEADHNKCLQPRQ